MQRIAPGPDRSRRRKPGIRFRSAWHLCLALMLALFGRDVAAARTTVVHMSADHGLPFYNYLRERAEIFERLNPDIDIVIETASGNYTEAVQVRLATNVQVNVLDSTHSFMVFAIQGLLADLRPYLERDGVDILGSIPSFALDVLGHGDAILGLPSQIYHVGAVYNRTLLEENGLTALAAIGDEWSWRWLEEQGRKLVRDHNGDGAADQFAAAFSTSFINMDPFVHQAGGMFYDRYLAPTESRFDSEEVRVGLGFVVDLFQSGLATGLNTPNFFRNRSAAVSLYGVPPQIEYIRESIDEFEVTTQPLGPVRRGGHTYFGPYHIVRSGDPAQDQAAYRWVRFLALDADSQVAMMEATGRLPIYLPVLRDLGSYLGSYPERDQEFFIAFAHVAVHPDNFPHYLTPAEPAISRAFNTGFADVLNGRESLTNFLITMHSLVQVELNR